jgi:tetratricopeptide (TPR) repeat protein
LITAGKAYLKLHAPAEAVAHLHRAWKLHLRELNSDAETRISVGLALASAMNSLDRADEASEVLDRLEQEDLQSVDRRRLARAFIESGWVRFSERSEVGAGRQLIEKGVDLVSGTTEGRDIEMGAYGYLARLHQQDGELGRAVANADRAAVLAREGGDRFFSIFALGAKGSALCDSGDLDAALAACLEAGRLAEESGNEFTIGLAHLFLAKPYVYLGEANKALEAAVRARRAGEQTRQVGALYHAAAWSGYAYLLLGQAASAMREFDRLAAINPRWPTALECRARGLLELGCYREAARIGEACIALDPPRLVRARALCTLGHARGLLGSKDRDSADVALLESLALCERLGLRPQLGEVRSAFAHVCFRRGEVSLALAHRAEAIRTFEECGMRLHAGLAARELGLGS